MPRIYDCIMLNAELDQLEARMEALEGVPGLVHIICEASVDYHGNPKPLHFRDSRDTRFARWRGRWNHVIAEPHEITGNTPEEHEASQREYLLHGFHGDPQDILFYADLEYTPPPGDLEEIARRKADPRAIGRQRKDITTIAELRKK